MSRNWRSRTLGIVGVGALVVGAGLVVTSPASAAQVGDADALRSAISDLNGTGPAAEIELVPGATYSLPGSAGCAEEQGNASGDLDILRSNALKIYTPDGQAPAVLEMTCDAEKSPQRVIKMLPFRTDDLRDLGDQRSLTAAAADSVGKLTLRNVTVRNGHAPRLASARAWGGAVLSAGDVSLENVRMENNAAGDGIAGDEKRADGQAGGSGGAVFALGNVHVEGSTLTGNRAGRGGDGMSRATTPSGDNGCDTRAGGNGGPGGSGGAVLALRGLDVVSSTFSGNTSGTGGNGGNGGCGFGNMPAGSDGGAGGAGGSGGALQCGLILVGDDVRPETACAASSVVTSSTLDGNSTGGGGTGGNGGDAIANATGGNGGRGGSFELNAIGGAILFIGRQTEAGPTTLTVENSTVDANSTGNGGVGGNGGRGGDSVTGGPGGNGGAAGDGGNGGQGGAVVAAFADRTRTEVAHLVHATITDNAGGGRGGAAGTPGEPGAGGGDEQAQASAAEAVALGEPGATGDAGEDKGGSVLLFPQWSSLSTVIGTTSPATDGPDCWSGATRATFSRSTDADTDSSGCGFGATSQLAFDTFGLGMLADNGGPTMTRLPSASSSLVDKVTGVKDQIVVDQRGVTRPQAAGADIGAVELQLIDMTLTKTASATSVPAGTTVTFTIVARGTGTSSPQPGVVIEDPKCGGLTTPTGDVNSNSTLDPTEAFTYTCTATPTEVGTFTNTVEATVTDGAGVKISRTASVDVAVTPAAGTPGTPPLADTGVEDPTPLLMTGAWMITGGALLLYLARPRRIRVRRLIR